MVLQELRVHHKTAAGLILQLPNGGYGRLAREGCGGDALGDRIIAAHSPHDTIVCASTGKADKDGYTLLTIDPAQLSTEIRFAKRTSSVVLLNTLFRINILCGLGRVVRAKVVTRRDEGAVLRLANGLTAVCLGKLPEAPVAPAADGVDDDDAAPAAPTLATVRILSFDDRAKGGIITCTADTAVVSRGYGSFEELSSNDSFRRFFVGDRIKCRVLLKTEVRGPNDVAQPLIVAEIMGSRGSGVGHFAPSEHELTTKSPLVYIPAAADAVTASIGESIEVQLTYVPNRAMVLGAPFLLASLETSELVGVPASRRFTDLTRTIVLPFAWRDPVVNAADDEAEQATEAEQQRVRRRQMEEAIDRYERQGEVAPSSPEEFEKQLLATPHSSYLWTQFMAHHIALRRVDAARTVAEKALQRIPVTAVDELTNVWVAYMNLENTYGTAESLAAVFRRAVERTDDQMLIHEKLADIFAATGKKQQLVELRRTMVGKFRSDKRVWEGLCRALIDTGKRDQVKRALKEMTEALPQKDHAPIVVHAAIHEYKHGAPEQGRGLFEGLVTKAPKRSDVWSAYLDQEMGLLARRALEASVPGVRQVFERLATLNLAPKVMQAFLTRWLGFEQEHGTPTQVQHVKDKARAYVEARATAATSAVVQP